MKTVPVLVCAALCTFLPRSSVVSEPVEYTEVVGRNVVFFTCLNEDLTRQEPPPGCIQDKLKCNVYKTPLKYLTWSGSRSGIRTYDNTASDKKRGLVYQRNDVQGRLYANISQLTLEDSGLYRCGVITPAGLDIYTEHSLTVIWGKRDPILYDPVTTTEMSTIRGKKEVLLFKQTPVMYTIRSKEDLIRKDILAQMAPTMAPVIPLHFTKHGGISIDFRKVEKVIGQTGSDLTVECPLKVLIPKPSVDCVLDYSKCQSYFQALMFLRRDGSTESIFKTYQDQGGSGRYSLRYSPRLVTVRFSNIIKGDEGQYVCGAVTPDGTTSSTWFQVLVEDADEWKAPSRPRPRLLLLLLLLLLVPAVLLLVGGLWLCRKRKSKRDSPKAETSGDIRLQDELYENIPGRALDSADATYQSLCVETRETSIYSSLNPGQ